MAHPVQVIKCQQDHAFAEFSKEAYVNRLSSISSHDRAINYERNHGKTTKRRHTHRVASFSSFRRKLNLICEKMSFCFLSQMPFSFSVFSRSVPNEANPRGSCRVNRATNERGKQVGKVGTVPHGSNFQADFFNRPRPDYPVELRAISFVTETRFAPRPNYLSGAPFRAALLFSFSEKNVAKCRDDGRDSRANEEKERAIDDTRDTALCRRAIPPRSRENFFLCFERFNVSALPSPSPPPRRLDQSLHLTSFSLTS